MVQTTATLNWPQHGELSSVTAPLISQTPVSHDRRRCRARWCATLPPRAALVLATAPAKGKDAALNALFVNVTETSGSTSPTATWWWPACRGPGWPVAGLQRIEITSSHDGTFATFVGLTTGRRVTAAHRVRRPEPAARDRRRVHRPDRPRAARPVALGDHRHPVLHHADALKLAAMLLAIVATVIALLALWRLDRLDGTADAPADPDALADLHRRSTSWWSAASCSGT